MTSTPPQVRGVADVGRSGTSAQSIRRGRVAYGGHRHRCASMQSRAGRTPPPSPHSFPYIFASALRAAGESMEAAPSSCARHSYTVNLLSKSPVGSPSGTACSRGALPMCLLEGRHRRRLRLGMGGCFAFFVPNESIRCRRVACHGSANRSLPPSPRAASQPGWPAQEVHVGLDELSVCDRGSRGALRFVVLLCSCVSLSGGAGVGVEGKNNYYLKLITIVDSTVR